MSASAQRQSEGIHAPLSPVISTAINAPTPATLASRAVARLTVNDLSMVFPNGHAALKGMTLSVSAGELVVILGSNGCGKSTLMKCMVGLKKPTTGYVEAVGRKITDLSGEALRVARLPIALISQQANLVRRRSVLANVCAGTLGRHRNLSTRLGFLPKSEFSLAHDCLAEVGLLHLAGQRADTLSGGQAQRVAVARALAQNPQVLLADEPVASLDPEAADEVMRLLRHLVSTENLAIVCVLHQPDLALRYADRVIGMRRGTLAFDRRVADATVHEISDLYVSEGV